jgi:hypothetical protein
VSPLITYLIAVFLAGGGILGIWDQTRAATRMRGTIILSVIAAVTVLLVPLTGFPIPRIATFGGRSPLVACALMLVAVMLGAAASYLFESKELFSWRELLRPMLTAPIILLPLLGSISPTGDLSDMQLVFLTLVAFQNGFFWKIVLQKAAVTLSKPSP